MIDIFQELTEQPTFVDYETMGLMGIDEHSNPLTILELLEVQDDWNFVPLEVLMANATPVPF